MAISRFTYVVAGRPSDAVPQGFAEVPGLPAAAAELFGLISYRMDVSGDEDQCADHILDLCPKRIIKFSLFNHKDLFHEMWPYVAELSEKCPRCGGGCEVWVENEGGKDDVICKFLESSGFKPGAFFHGKLCDGWQPSSDFGDMIAVRICGNGHISLSFSADKP